ncbi:hypothetical protein CAMRE0001_1085 [Campylobacter rectus RM3267]|uniref:Uncharacterized protein n=2 Tax=Campylobacter rectus TaxID=203 RepID=A0A6G5QMC4_CAMRE|nr:hypothetical protein [Campylobacter rectus]EEF12577.1 hypothetical protein CAMRE0001_1085 [Campylobacter rectus RM3267]QCD46801.1 hypothetical protein CRECT_1141 [Campylobacter rectus]UEB47506.1 hypothetical protein LK437_10995 [Campylobacter rectus]
MKFYRSIKFKTLAGTLLLITILCAAFIRIIPDYSTSRGFAVVSIFGYNKYQQGYCLKENRILPREELYKRAIGQYLDYDLKLDQMIDDYRAYTYGSSWRSSYEIAYYELEGINLSNWFEIIKGYYNGNKTIENIFMDILKAKKTDPKKYLKINLNDMSAGFDRPIMFFDQDFFLKLDMDFILSDGRFANNYFLGYFLDEEDVRKYYEHKDPAYLHNVKFDNCGNIDYDLKKIYMDTREARGG